VRVVRLVRRYPSDNKIGARDHGESGIMQVSWNPDADYVDPDARENNGYQDQSSLEIESRMAGADR